MTLVGLKFSAAFEDSKEKTGKLSTFKIVAVKPTRSTGTLSSPHSISSLLTSAEAQRSGDRGD